MNLREFYQYLIFVYILDEIIAWMDSEILLSTYIFSISINNKE